jgi:hypothetical protein
MKILANGSIPTAKQSMNVFVCHVRSGIGRGIGFTRHGKLKASERSLELFAPGKFNFGFPSLKRASMDPKMFNGKTKNIKNAIIDIIVAIGTARADADDHATVFMIAKVQHAIKGIKLEDIMHCRTQNLPPYRA